MSHALGSDAGHPSKTGTPKQETPAPSFEILKTLPENT
jgi:hypothetical protein